MIKNINENYGDAQTFETVAEMAAAIESCGYEIPEAGLVEGVDYAVVADKITVPVYVNGGLSADAEINPDEVESKNQPAEPTSRCLDGTNDHWAAEEWAEQAIMPDGRECTKYYLFAANDITDDDGNPKDADNYPWDAAHVSRIVLADTIDIADLIDRAGGQSKFSRLHGIPLRTVQDWAGGKRQPPTWLIKILDKITK